MHTLLYIFIHTNIYKLSGVLYIYICVCVCVCIHIYLCMKLNVNEIILISKEITEGIWLKDKEMTI